MTNVQDKLVALNRANLETVISAANIALDSVERLVDVNLSAAKSAVADSARTAKALGSVKDVQGLASLQPTLGEPGVEKLMGYSRSVYEITAAAQANFAKLVEERVSDYNQDVIAVLEQVAKTAPAGVGADAAIAAMKSAMSAASTAYDTMNKAAKQVVEATEANVTAIATKTTAKKKAA